MDYVENNTMDNQEVTISQKRLEELQRYEAAVQTLAADLDRDGAGMVSDIQRGDRFALVIRYRSLVRDKLREQDKVIKQLLE